MNPHVIVSVPVHYKVRIYVEAVFNKVNNAFENIFQNMTIIFVDTLDS